mmetsp:Transcript_9098/g.11840  ORF Transcript_9098/g.11840 Transcript_9098/m.11840 type:complete len:219 (-) Transcript_9098:206-862(-)
MNIFITGFPGCGKTTLISRVCSSLPGTLEPLGFYTEEVRDHRTHQRVGFDVVTLDGQRTPLARVSHNETRGGRGRTRKAAKVGKYDVDVQSFERLVLPLLQEAKGCPLVVIDEVGKMELFSRSFQSLVGELLDSATIVLGTIPCPKNGRADTGIYFVDLIRQRQEDTKVYEISSQMHSDNRDQTLENILYDINSFWGETNEFCESKNKCLGEKEEDFK